MAKAVKQRNARSTSGAGTSEVGTMNMTRKIETDAQGTLFEVLDEQRVGMLGVSGSGQHMQPMTHFADPDACALWFVTSRDTDLVRAVGQGAQAHHCVMKSDGTLYACLAGTLEQSSDSAKLDELWSAVTAAWFEEGREDPDVVLLRFSLRDAGVWTATDSGIVFGLEIARANMSAERQPDVGEHTVVRFGDA